MNDGACETTDAKRTQLHSAAREARAESHTPQALTCSISFQLGASLSRNRVDATKEDTRRVNAGNKQLVLVFPFSWFFFTPSLISA